MRPDDDDYDDGKGWVGWLVDGVNPQLHWRQDKGEVKFAAERQMNDDVV